MAEVSSSSMAVVQYFLCSVLLIIGTAADDQLLKRILLTDPSYVHSLELEIQDLKTKVSQLQSLTTKVTQMQNQLTDLAKTSTNVQVLHSCPDGFIHHDHSCYKIHHDELSWPEAYSFCKAFNSHLAVENSVEEHNFLKQKLSEIQGSYTGKAYWIGASDANTEGDWIWADGQGKANLTWASGEPNQGSFANCAVFWKDFLYDIGDVPCSSAYNFICEIELAET